MEERPKYHDFESHVGKAYEVTFGDGQSAGSWILKSTSLLTPPDDDDLRMLECFELVFTVPSGHGLSQGIVHLKGDGENISTAFAVPFRQNMMVVTIN